MGVEVIMVETKSVLIPGIVCHEAVDPQAFCRELPPLSTACSLISCLRYSSLLMMKTLGYPET
jgi:hypothetical protein